MPPVLLLAALCGVSYWLNPESWHHLSLSTQLVLAAAFAVFAILMIVMRNRSWLRIDERGIEVKFATGTTRFYAWQDIISAGIGQKRIFLVPVFSSIQLQLSPTAKPTNTLEKAAWVINRYDATFPSYFDISPTEILERIQFYKSQNQPL